jgi:hypothetical protein
MDTTPITPSRWYYVLAAVIFIAGWALFAGFLFQSLSGMEAGLQRVVVPGEMDITLRERGRYTISYEYRSVIAGKIYSTAENISGLECTLVSKANGSKVALSLTSVNTTYEFGGHAGRAIFDFTIDQPGIYTLTAAYPEGRQGPEIVLAVGEDSTIGLFTTIFTGFAIAFGTIGVSLAITLVTLIKRSNKKKKLLASQG